MSLASWVKIISYSLQSDRPKEVVDSMIREISPRRNGVYYIQSKKIWENIITTDNGCLNVLKKKRIETFDDFERWQTLEHANQSYETKSVTGISVEPEGGFWDNDDDAVRNYYEEKILYKVKRRDNL